MMKKLFQVMARSFFIFLIGIILYSLFPSAASGAGCVTPPPGLVGWWPLDEVTGSHIHDKSGMCNNGLLYGLNTSNVNVVAQLGVPAGMGWIPLSRQGEVMGAIMFLGSFDLGNNPIQTYTEVPDSPSLNFAGNDFSIDAWIKPDTDPYLSCNLAGRHVTPIIDKWDASGKGYRFFVEQGSNSTVPILHLVIGDGVNLVRALAPINISLCCNGWVHVTAVYRSGSPNNTIDLYNDGVQVSTTVIYNGISGSNTFPAIGSLDNTNDLFVGRIDPLPAVYADAGVCEMPIDEVEVFSLAVPQSDISSIFNAGPDGKCKKRVTVPATRQMTCYSASGTVVPCANTGQDGEVQAGAPWPGVRFVDYQTHVTPITNDIVRDNLTGIEWMQDAGTPTVPGCFTGQAGCFSGQCTGGPKTWQQALDYVDCLNSILHLGHNDWRMPNINELNFVHGRLNPVSSTYLTGWLTGRGFTNVQTEYWSSTSAASSLTSFAWAVGLDVGIVDYDPNNLSYYNGFHYYVWPVRRGPSPKRLGHRADEPCCHRG
jgi:hypothetical protein